MSHRKFSIRTANQVILGTSQKNCFFTNVSRKNKRDTKRRKVTKKEWIKIGFGFLFATLTLIQCCRQNCSRNLTLRIRYHQRLACLARENPMFSHSALHVKASTILFNSVNYTVPKRTEQVYCFTSCKSTDSSREAIKHASTTFHEYTAFVIETPRPSYAERVCINRTSVVDVCPAIW